MVKELKFEDFADAVNRKYHRGKYSQVIYQCTKCGRTVGIDHPAYNTAFTCAACKSKGKKAYMVEVT